MIGYACHYHYTRRPREYSHDSPVCADMLVVASGVAALSLALRVAEHAALGLLASGARPRQEPDAVLSPRSSPAAAAPAGA